MTWQEVAVILAGLVAVGIFQHLDGKRRKRREEKAIRDGLRELAEDEKVMRELRRTAQERYRKWRRHT